MHRVINNFLTKEDLLSISKFRDFNPFQPSWVSKENLKGYQIKILEEASKTYNLDKAIGIEEWHHNPCFMPLPTEHYDKDEILFKEKNHLRFPLCSCVLYMKIENLRGARLIIDKRIEIVPESNTLVLISPGITHRVTDYVSGTRTSLNINFWDYKVR
jgi:hypothetical protein